MIRHSVIAMPTPLTWCNHDLETHLRNVATLVMCPGEAAKQEQYRNVRIGRLGRVINAIVNSLSVITGWPVKRVRTALGISAYLHDIGKALSIYQREFEKCGKENEILLLDGYQIWSAWVAYHVFEGLETLKILRIDSTPYIIGIMLYNDDIYDAVIDEYYQLKDKYKPSDLEDLILGEIQIGGLSIEEWAREATTKLIQEGFYPRPSDVEEIIKLLKHIEEICGGALKLNHDFYDYVKTALSNDTASIKEAAEDMVDKLMSVVSRKYGDFVAYVITITDYIDSWAHGIISRKYGEEITQITFKKYIKTKKPNYRPTNRFTD